MKTNITFHQNKQEFRLFVTKTHTTLLKLKQDGDRASFNALVLKVVPKLRVYINNYLAAAIKKGHFSKGKYKADDFIDQLFIEIYDHIEEVKHEKEFYVWLYKKTNDLLEDISVEEEFNDYFFKNIDDYSKPEWDAMEEKFSTDGDGDLMMIEELDDISYNHNNYTLNHVFIENKENSLIETLDETLKEDVINNHIAMVLRNLPLAMRNVFQLYTNEHLELEEIAKIKNTTIDEVQELLADAKKALQVSLFNRFAN